MKRWFCSLFICCYLTALSFGIFSHAMGVHNTSHPAMYFVIWDMFCGWSAYSTRSHIIAEGESGKYYELSPGPWGEFRPYGPLDRIQYDTFSRGVSPAAKLALKYTDHEPITRILVIEESWSKRYNLNEEAWQVRYEGQPRDVQKYYHLRGVLDSEGEFLFYRQNWLSSVYNQTLFANPRLQAEQHLGKPFYTFNLPSASENYRGGSVVELQDMVDHAALGN